MTSVYSQILRAATAFEFEMLVYCFMPDHLHLLVHGKREDSDLKRFMALAKQYSGFSYSKQFGKRLWQRYGYERIVRDEQATPAIARYILMNPVRAGLVSSVEQYAFVGSSVYSIRELLEWMQSG